MMQLIRAIRAYYPQFELGCEPRAVECELRLLQASDGAYYLKTPFAFLNAEADTDFEPHFANGYRPGGYYRTAEECEQYLAREYPHWKAAQPIMEKLFLSHREGFAGYQLADAIGECVDVTFKIARGHRTVSAARVKSAVKQLSHKGN